MSFSRKITIFCLLIFLAAPFVGWYMYRQAHPKYVPKPIPPRPEVTITLLPGWNLRQIGDYLVKMGLASSTQDLYDLVGEPAVVRTRRAGPPPNLVPELTVLSQKPPTISYEGYLAPETYRVFKDASLESIVTKVMDQREQELTDLKIGDLNISEHIFGNKKGMPDLTVHDVMTMASILEREARTPEDKKMVADIMWRRSAAGAALQIDSSVHYVVDRFGDVFTTDKERDVDSLWNTYKYPGLPPGPISNPSVASIKAALDPTPNEYWYFLSGTDGTMHYAKTLEAHNANRAKYL
jgi:UPF0755 protein